MFKRIRRLIYLFLFLFLAFYGYQTYQNVKAVLSHRSMVRQVLGNQDSEEVEDLVLAMIYTESKGQATDLMQASESASGYINTINDKKESVQQGVEYLKKNLILAKQAGVDQWTAIQAYNFGQGYIDYVAKHGGENTIAVAQQYSKEVLAPSLGNKSGKSYWNYHPIALINGGKLYVDGGNIYYSRQVQFNLQLIKLFKGK